MNVSSASGPGTGMAFAPTRDPAKAWRQAATRVAAVNRFAASRPASAQSGRRSAASGGGGSLKSSAKGTRDLATSPLKGPSPRARYLSCDVSTSPLSPGKTAAASGLRSPYLRASPSAKSSPGYGSTLRASQFESRSAKSPGRLSVVSPGSPTGKLVRTRQQNEALQAELRRLQDAFEDIDDRNQALVEEKEQVSQRLSEVQEKLHQETEGYFEKSAYAKSVAQQLQEEQHKVLKLRRAVDNMELDVCQPAPHVCAHVQAALVSSVNSSALRAARAHTANGIPILLRMGDCQGMPAQASSNRYVRMRRCKTCCRRRTRKFQTWTQPFEH